MQNSKIKTSKKTNALVIAYDRIGARMAGPGVRSWELAHALASDADVTVASSDPIERESDAVTTVHFESEQQLEKLVSSADVILIQGLSLRKHPCLQRCDAVLIVDLYDPWVLENMEMYGSFTDERAAALLFSDADVQNELVDHGDFFICASERQRDYWLGMLTSRLRLDRPAWQADHELRDLIDVVPYGAPTRAPLAGPALRNVHPKVTADDAIFLWSGGTWEWFDPLVVLEGFAKAQKEHPNMVLYFMGLGIKGRTPDMPVAKRLKKRATELELLGDRVIFGDWVEYDKRDAHLLEATAAVLATRPSAESRLAFRSRMLDHFWTSLPTISTPGDTLAELVASSGAGTLIPFDDANAWRDELLRLARDEDRTKKMSEAAGQLAASYAWENAAIPLKRVAQNPARWVQQREQRFELRDECHIPQVGMQGIGLYQGSKHSAPTVGFHSRGPVIDWLKRSRLYPLMRKLRRSGFGIKVWGDVPGE